MGYDRQYCEYYFRQRLSKVLQESHLLRFLKIYCFWIETLTTCGSFKLLVQYCGKGFHKTVHSPCRGKWFFYGNQYGFRSKYSIWCLISNLKRHVFSTKHKFYTILQMDLSNAFVSADTEIIFNRIGQKFDTGAYTFLIFYYYQ